MIRNKARVEGSICESWLLQEASSFISMYDKNKKKKKDRHDDGGEIPDDDRLSIWRCPGRGTRPHRSRYWPERRDLYDAHLCVINNTPEAQQFKT